MNKIKDIGLIFTRQCTAECAHCGSSSGPDKQGVLSFETSTQCLKTFSKLGLNQYYITGGEPFVFFKKMNRVIHSGHESGLSATVCTNAFWGKNQSTAREFLKQLKDNGLGFLMLSTDVFHIKTIPVNHVITVANLSHELEIPCHISIPALKNDWTALSLFTLLKTSTLASVAIHHAHPIGRGENLPRHLFEKTSIRLLPCEFVGLLEIDVQGSISCCPASADFPSSSSLLLGNINDRTLSEIVDTFGSTLLYYVMQNYGPLGLAYLFQNALPIDDCRFTTNGHPCHFCRNITQESELFNQFAAATGMNLLTPVNDETFRENSEIIATMIARHTNQEGKFLND